MRPHALVVLSLGLLACATRGQEVELVPVSGRQRFDRPLYFAQAPGGSKLAFVVEQGGTIWACEFDGRSLGERRVFLDLTRKVLTRGNEEGLLGLAFHPRYDENGAFFVYYSAARPRRTVLSRFEGGRETVLLQIDQPYSNHNGGMIEFGPDGYLYVGVGDGGSGGDPHGNGQSLETHLAKILRLDVDRSEGERPYAIPPDNPFRERPGARPEIFAYGIRNPWRFSFDRRLGTLFVGDVGQDAEEEVDVVVAGGNYGWNAFEGDRVYDRHAGLARADAEFPIATYGRGEGKSITGGYVYRGRAVPSLAGRYVYADYVSGTVWSLRWNGRHAEDARVLLESGLEISSFGEDRAGEIYACAFDGRVYRFAESTGRRTEPDPLPETLSATGVLAREGGFRYEVNVPLWSDGAEKDRMLLLPPGGRIGFRDDGAWEFPVGTTFVKTFRFGDRKLETRLLLHESTGWRGVTYRWNEAGTEARLLEGALTETVSAGGRRRTWYYPSPGECLECHTEAAGFVLGGRTRQMNRDGQVAELVRRGLFDGEIPDPATLPAFPAVDSDAPVAGRVRAYLDSNCAMCHQPGGPGNARIDLRHSTPLERTGLLEEPGQGDLGVAGAQLLAPGDPERSLLLVRMLRRGPGQMPNLATNVPDEPACRSVREWIEGMPRK